MAVGVSVTVVVRCVAMAAAFTVNVRGRFVVMRVVSGMRFVVMTT